MASAPSPQPPSDLLGGILVCGGRSRRMGRDKARLVVHGRPLIERAAQALAGVCDEVVLACGGEPRYGHLGLPVALDSVPAGGPMAGIHAGLKQLGTALAVVVACDMPRLSSDLLAELLRTQQAGDFDVCFLRTEGGREPLCAIYSCSVLPAMEEALQRGWRKVTSFLEVEDLGAALRVGYLTLQDSSLDAQSAVNLNTPEEFERETMELAP